MVETPNETHAWSWPERSAAGTPSLPPSADSPSSQSPPAAGSDLTYQQPDQLPGESQRSATIRSTLITLTSTLVASASAFGFKLDEAQATALIAVVTSLSALVALIMAGRRRA